MTPTVLLLAFAAHGAEPPPASASDGPGALEVQLAAALDRARGVFGAEDEPPHYISVAVTDREERSLVARDGTLAVDRIDHQRLLDVDLRTGTPALDSSHPLRGFSAMSDDDREPVVLPLEDGPALGHAVTRELDRRYRAAREAIVLLRANRAVKVEEEIAADDFEPRTGEVSRVAAPPLEYDERAIRELVVALSADLDASPAVQSGSVTVSGDRVTTTFVDTEGARLVTGRRHYRVSIAASAVAPDGDEVAVYVSKDVRDPASLPERAELAAWVAEAKADLAARLAAPRAEPYVGPVLLRGRAAAVFFHEVLGHRVEGQRQKREDEGRTFAEMVGQRVLPTWLDVVDDPTIERLAGQDLNGHYTYDDEGVRGEAATIVDDGVFRGFLLYRSPIPGFPHSNGHGRRSSGNPAEARMGNTIVSNAQPLPVGELRARLAATAKEQGLPYGYLVDEIEGGFTLTGRVTPNAFNVRAASVWRVFVDGRPDELVRGLDLVGTPLVAFENLVAAGDDPEVFNGYCGSDSGWVPVSGVAPSVLFSRLEFQLKEKGQERPPLLAKPSAPADGGDS